MRQGDDPRRLLFMLPALKQNPETGGENYNLHLARMLGQRYALRTLTMHDVGVEDWRRDPAFGRALIEAATSTPRGALVLQDTYFYEILRPVNEALFREGLGPIIGFGQAVYPDRYESLLARTWHNVVLARYLRTCDAHIVVGEEVKRTYMRLGIPESSISVVHPGHDLAAMPPLRKRAPLQGRDLLVIVAGSYQPSKGQGLVLEGAALLLERSPRLRGRFSIALYGNTEFCPGFFDGLREVAADRHLSGHVQLHGPIPQHELWEHFSASDLLVFPASGEGRPLVVTEAMLNGCVPAVPGSGRSTDLVLDGETGLLIERSAQGVAVAIERMLAQPERLPQLSWAAALQARALFPDWSATMARYARVLEMRIRSCARAPLAMGSSAT